jgi:hypothetical protein
MIIYLIRTLYNAAFPSNGKEGESEKEFVPSDVESPKDTTPVRKFEKTPDKEESQCSQLLAILLSLLDWAVLIVMLVLPSITSDYRIVFGVSFGLGAAFEAYHGYGHYISHAVKVFPKVFDLGLLTINFSLLLFEVISNPSSSWSRNWTGVIVNSCLLGLVLLSMVIGKPFTIQFAMEKVPEHLWTTPSFMSVNYLISFVWAVEFTLSIIFNILGVYVYPDNNAARIAPGTVTLVLAILFTKKYPEYAREQAKKRSLLENNGQDTKQQAIFPPPI